MLRYSFQAGAPAIPMNLIVAALKSAGAALVGTPLTFAAVEFRALPDHNNAQTCFVRMQAAGDVRLTSRVENGHPPGYKQEHVLEVLGGKLRAYGQYYDTTLWEVTIEATGLDAHYETIRRALSEVIGKDKDRSAHPWGALTSAKTLLAAGQRPVAVAILKEAKALVEGGVTDMYEKQLMALVAAELSDASTSAEELPELTGALVRKFIQAGNVERLKLYFERGLGDGLHDAVLQSAAFRGDVELAQWILDRHAFEAHQIQHTLVNATAGKHAALFPVLVHAGADINQPSAFDILPLGTASFHGDVALCEAMLDAGADANVVSKFPNKLKPTYCPDVDGQSPVLNALREGHVDVMALLLGRGGDANLKTLGGRTLLEVAEEFGDSSVVALLKAHGATGVDPSSLDIVEAAKRGLAERVRELLSDTDAEKRDSVMVHAMQGGHHALAREVADAGLSERGYQNGLYHSVTAGRVDDAKYFIAKGADVHDKSFQGFYLIHYAAGNGQVEMVRFLIESGQKVDQRTDDGDTPMHRAAARAQVDVITLLLELGGDPNAVSGDGSTPLSGAQDDATKALLMNAGSSKSASASSLADLKRSLKKVARGTYRFAYLAVGKSGPSLSKFGGAPGLLEGEAWPAHKGKPLRFFGQIDFADLPKSAQKKLGKQMLQVFLAADVSPTGGAGTFIRWVDKAALHAAEVPDGVELFAETLIEDFRRSVKDYPLREYGLKEWDALSPHEQQRMQEANHTGEKVGGWPHWIQEATYASCTECDAKMSTLVLQIDSGHALDFSFGDNGAAFVLACPKHPDVLSFQYQCT